MTNPISATNVAARESARQADGKFGTQLRPETEMALFELDQDDIDFARETLGPDATSDEVMTLAAQRAELARSEHLPVTSSESQEPTTVIDFASTYGPKVLQRYEQWRDEPDLGDDFNVLAVRFGRHVLDMAEDSDPERPGLDKVRESLEHLEGVPAGELEDDDIEELHFRLIDATSRDAMKVFQTEDGGHILAFDGKPGYTCPQCGFGFATAAVLLVHRENDCEGAIDAEDAAQDEEDYEELHATADAFAAEVNNSGVDAQTAFLRRHGVNDEDIDLNDLDGQVHDVASSIASDHYNDASSPADLKSALAGTDTSIPVGNREALRAAQPGDRFRDADDPGSSFTVGPASVRYYDGCATCANNQERGSSFFPPHQPSPRCQSGGRPHCTCDACF